MKSTNEKMIQILFGIGLSILTIVFIYLDIVFIKALL